MFWSVWVKHGVWCDSFSSRAHTTLYGNYTKSIHLCDVDADDDDDGMKSGRLQFVRYDFKIDLSLACVQQCVQCALCSVHSKLYELVFGALVCKGVSVSLAH